MSLILSGTDGLSDVDGSAATPAIRGTDANTGIFFPAADTIAFSEGGVECARFNADSQFVAAAGTAALPVITTTGDTNTGIFFPAADQVAISTGGTQKAVVNASGLVGVGTTSPARTLHVKAGGVTTLANSNGALFTDAANAGVLLGSDNILGYISGVNVAGTATVDLVLQPFGGNLLVGTTSASGRLTVKGAGTTNATSAVYITNSAGAYTLAINDDGAFYTGATPAAAPYNNNIGAVRTLMVNSSGVLGYNASTRNTKINITPLTNVNWLFNLAPVSFNYREKDDEGNYTDVAKADVHYGLIAEDTETVNKELCFYNADGSLAGVNYDMLAPALLKVIQEQQALILSLTDRITALETP